MLQIKKNKLPKRRQRKRNAHTGLQRLGLLARQEGWLSSILTNTGLFCWPGEQTSEGEEKEVYQADGVSEGVSTQINGGITTCQSHKSGLEKQTAEVKLLLGRLWAGWLNLAVYGSTRCLLYHTVLQQCCASMSLRHVTGFKLGFT